MMKSVGSMICVVAVIAISLSKINAQDLVPVVQTSDQYLLCGDPPVVLGKVEATVEAENLEVHVKLSPTNYHCKIIESHICNMPVPTQEGDNFVDYSIPIETVYDFVCTYESDFFMVAGHATVKCEDELVGLVGVDNNRLRRLEEKDEEGFVYAAYYEIPLSCEEAGLTTTVAPGDDTTTTTTTTTTVAP